MKHELKVPTVGESIQEVQIGKWLKGEGQWANQDESLVEIESDKATVDLAAPVAGIVVEVLHRQGDVVPVGTLIGYLEESARPDGAVHPVSSAGGRPAETESGGTRLQSSRAAVANTPPVLLLRYHRSPRQLGMAAQPASCGRAVPAG